MSESLTVKLPLIAALSRDDSSDNYHPVFMGKWGKDLQEVGCRYVDWIGLAQDRNRWRTLVSAVMNLQFP